MEIENTYSFSIILKAESEFMEFEKSQFSTGTIDLSCIDQLAKCPLSIALLAQDELYQLIGISRTDIETRFDNERQIFSEFQILLSFIWFVQEQKARLYEAANLAFKFQFECLHYYCVLIVLILSMFAKTDFSKCLKSTCRSYGFLSDGFGWFNGSSQRISSNEFRTFKKSWFSKETTNVIFHGGDKLGAASELSTQPLAEGPAEWAWTKLF